MFALYTILQLAFGSHRGPCKDFLAFFCFDLENSFKANLFHLSLECPLTYCFILNLGHMFTHYLLKFQIFILVTETVLFFGWDYSSSMFACFMEHTYIICTNSRFWPWGEDVHVTSKPSREDGAGQGAATEPTNQWRVCCTAVTDLGDKDLWFTE